MIKNEINSFIEYLDNEETNNLRHTCHTCLYRRGEIKNIKNECRGFMTNEKYERVGKCPDWKIGLCYSCIHIDEELEEWLHSGCEAMCMSGCERYEKKGDKE